MKAAMAIVIIIGLGIVYGIVNTSDPIGKALLTALLFPVVITIITITVKVIKKENRIKCLKIKYPDEELYQKILHGYFWQGQTEDQLRDSIGKPCEIDRKVMKTKTTEIWKYDWRRRNSYGLKITLENGYVAGWFKKG